MIYSYFLKGIVTLILAEVPYFYMDLLKMKFLLKVLKE